jgi:hypothetical protein
MVAGRSADLLAEGAGLREMTEMDFESGPMVMIGALSVGPRAHRPLL